jgi:hypothetical protein
MPRLSRPTLPGSLSAPRLGEVREGAGLKKRCRAGLARARASAWAERDDRACAAPGAPRALFGSAASSGDAPPRVPAARVRPGIASPPNPGSGSASSRLAALSLGSGVTCAEAVTMAVAVAGLAGRGGAVPAARAAWSCSAPGPGLLALGGRSRHWGLRGRPR